MVCVLEYAVEGKTLFMQSTYNLVLLESNYHMHQVQGVITWVPRRCTVHSRHIGEVSMLPPQVNLQSSKGD